MFIYENNVTHVKFSYTLWLPMKYVLHKSKRISIYYLKSSTGSFEIQYLKF